MRSIPAIVLLLGAVQVASADDEVVQPGRVVGRIVDGTTGEGFPAATIQVKEVQVLASELDGTFQLTLPPGTYQLLFTTLDYIEQTRTITIASNQELVLADVVLAMLPAKATEETIEVFDTIDTHKSSAVLAERRAAATVSDAISAEQISRSPDSSGADAAKRMVAATVQDNRYVVIRGLGGRYSLTLLNGVPLPSPDPDMPAAPLDLFPASLITNLTIDKTFSPDMPANVAGGALGIETRTYPTKLTFKAKVGVANNSLSSWRGLNEQNGGTLDILGFDDGTRALPTTISPTKLATGSNAEIASFKNTWTLEQGKSGPNLSLGARASLPTR